MSTLFIILFSTSFAIWRGDANHSPRSQQTEQARYLEGRQQEASSRNPEQGQEQNTDGQPAQRGPHEVRRIGKRRGSSLDF